MSVLQTCSRHPQAVIYQSSCLFDDFYNYTSGNAFTTDTTNSGTVAVAAPDNILLTSGSTIANYIGIHSTLAAFTFTSGVGMMAECLINWTDYSSLSADVFFGFASTLVVSVAGAQPVTSFSGAMIQRLSGSNVWSCQSSNGTAKSNNVSTTPANGGGSYLLHVDVFNFDSLNAGISYIVNGNALIDSVTGIQIIHKVPYASIAASNIYLTAQTSVADAQTLTCDYITASKNRNIVLSNS